MLVESGKSDVSFDDIVTGRAKISAKDPYNPNSGLAIFNSFDEVLSHHMTSGLNPKTVEILSVFDQMRSEFFGPLKGSLANDQFSRKRNYDLLVNRYGKARVDA